MTTTVNFCTANETRKIIKHHNIILCKTFVIVFLPLVVKQAGFKGCMKDIQIDRVPLPYTDTNSAGGDFTFPGVEFECHESFYGVCSINPCLNGGTCLETGNRVQCSCKGI